MNNVFQLPVPVFTWKLPEWLYREDVERYERKKDNYVYAILKVGEPVRLSK